MAAVGDGEVLKTWSTMRFHRTARLMQQPTTGVLLSELRVLYCEDKLESWDQVQGQDPT